MNTRIIDLYNYVTVLTVCWLVISTMNSEERCIHLSLFNMLYTKLSYVSILLHITWSHAIFLLTVNHGQKTLMSVSYYHVGNVRGLIMSNEGNNGSFIHQNNLIESFGSNFYTIKQLFQCVGLFDLDCLRDLNVARLFSV